MIPELKHGFLEPRVVRVRTLASSVSLVGRRY